MKKKVVKERKLKRVFDIIVSIFLLILLSPLIMLIALFLKLEGLINPAFKGPVFYKETRISKDKPFQIYKFRTVKSNILNLLCKNKNDSITQYTGGQNKCEYLTPIGCILAQVYFDELPQLFNVIKGDLSLVGPRPHLTSHYEDDLKSGVVSAKYIKAGVMGLVQASKGNPKMRQTIARMAARHITKDKTIVLIDRVYFQKYLKVSAIEMLFYDIGIMFRCLRVIREAKGF